MAMTQRTAPMPLLLLALIASANALNALTYKGCYASSSGLSDAGSYQYQTSGYCQPMCVGKNSAVLGLSNGSDCWCGDKLPPVSSLVDDSKCNTPCNGFGQEKCGGTNYWTVYLTGLSTDVTNVAAVVDPSSSSSSSASTPTSTSPPSPSTTTTTGSSTTSTTDSSPSVVTVSPGNTVVVTVSASASNTAGAGSGSGSGSTSVAGVAAGVVVGVIAFAAIIGGVFIYLRHRRRRQAEEDYKHSAQVADFMRGGGERKAPNTGYSQMSDSRLDPEVGRRNSVGSMADEHDYSRRILRVANPDSH